METIKSFTSLEQSKKLAEILPVESADMHYCFNFDLAMNNWWRTIPNVTKKDNHFELYPNDIPCWSLAALIELIPYECRMEKTPLDQTGEFTYSFIDDYYNIRTYEEGNPVDACVEMILKLKEREDLL